MKNLNKQLSKKETKSKPKVERVTKVIHITQGDDDELKALTNAGSLSVCRPVFLHHYLKENMTGSWGIRKVECFKKERQVGEGTYGQVWMAKDRDTGTVVALKRILVHRKAQGVPAQAIREIHLLNKLNHPNIATLHEIVSSTNAESSLAGSLYLVFEYVEHDLSGLLDTNYKFTLEEVKCLMKQLIEAMNYLHEQKVCHRDIKSSNLLVNNFHELKVTDFGLAREMNQPKGHKYTNKVITLWYRPPELLLGEQEYTTSVDIWSVGCIFVEMFTRAPLFPGKSDFDQIKRIFALCGTPTAKEWPRISYLPRQNLLQCDPNPFVLDKYLGSIMDREAGYLVSLMLALDPTRRISAANALSNSFWSRHPATPQPRALSRLRVSEASLHEWETKKKRKAAEKAKQQALASGQPLTSPTKLKDPNHSLARENISSTQTQKSHARPGEWSSAQQQRNRNGSRSRSSFHGQSEQAESSMHESRNDHHVVSPNAREFREQSMRETIRHGEYGSRNGAREHGRPANNRHIVGQGLPNQNDTYGSRHTSAYGDRDAKYSRAPVQNDRTGHRNVNTDHQGRNDFKTGGLPFDRHRTENQRARSSYPEERGKTGFDDSNQGSRIRREKSVDRRRDDRHGRSAQRDDKRVRSADRGDRHKHSSYSRDDRRGRSVHRDDRRDRSVHSNDGLKHSSYSRDDRRGRSVHSNDGLKHSSYSRDDRRDRSVHRDDRRDRSVHRDDRRDRSVHRDDRRDRSVHRDDRRDRSVHRDDRRGRSVHRDDRRDRSVHRDDRRDRSVHRDDRRDRSVHRDDRRDRSVHSNDGLKHSSYSRDDRRGRSVHRDDRRDRSVHRDDRRDRSVRRDDKDTSIRDGKPNGVRNGNDSQGERNKRGGGGVFSSNSVKPGEISRNEDKSDSNRSKQGSVAPRSRKSRSSSQTRARRVDRNDVRRDYSSSAMSRDDVARKRGRSRRRESRRTRSTSRYGRSRSRERHKRSRRSRASRSRSTTATQEDQIRKNLAKTVGASARLSNIMKK